MLLKFTVTISQFWSDNKSIFSMKRACGQKTRRDSLTMSTSEIVSKLSTWTSTPTGIAGPEKEIRGHLYTLINRSTKQCNTIYICNNNNIYICFVSIIRIWIFDHLFIYLPAAQFQPHQNARSEATQFQDDGKCSLFPQFYLWPMSPCHISGARGHN